MVAASAFAAGGYSRIAIMTGLVSFAQEFMKQHGFSSIEEFRGASLPYFTTHHELVRMQREAVAAKKRARTGLSGDDKWSGDGFVREAESMVAN